MFRPKASVLFVLPVLVAVVALSGCSSPNAQEENIVKQYFRASGLRDNQTLANFALVSFDPKVEGTVTDFDVTAVSPERSEPLRVIELSKVVRLRPRTRPSTKRRRPTRTPTWTRSTAC